MMLIIAVCDDEQKIGERFGYGYSDKVNSSRDVDTMLSETRTALSILGETGSFVLFPHSMSGIKSLRWAQMCPDEVLGIVGIDMGLPSVYLSGHIDLESQQSLLGMLTWMGLHRLPFLYSVSFPYPINDSVLTQDENIQLRLLNYRNALNRTMHNEGHYLFDNSQAEFAQQSGAQIEFFDSGHFLHQYEPERIANLSREFIYSISQD